MFGAFHVCDTLSDDAVSCNRLCAAPTRVTWSPLPRDTPVAQHQQRALEGGNIDQRVAVSHQHIGQIIGLDTAERSLRRGASEGVRAGNMALLGLSLAGLAAVAAARGPAERVARIYGALSAIQEEANVPLAPAAARLPGGVGRPADHIANARAQLDAAAFAAAWAAGRAMMLEQAVAYALDGDGHEVSGG